MKQSRYCQISDTFFCRSVVHGKQYYHRCSVIPVSNNHIDMEVDNTLKRIADALERIATALERMPGVIVPGNDNVINIIEVNGDIAGHDISKAGNDMTIERQK